jgi:hypothetical protein
MATRSTIGIIDNRTGVVTSIYCHWDGYPEHNGRILAEHYSNPEKIRALIALGPLSSLGAEIGEQHDFKSNSPLYCTAYGRDRGEEIDAVPEVYETLEDFLHMGQGYNYLWDGVRWNCFKGDDVNATIDLYGIKQTA